MKILITGSDGYVGRALVEEIVDSSQAELICVDNYARRDWVEKVGGSNQDLKDPFYDHSECLSICGDLTNYNFVREIITIHKPDVIIHLASQPSMPYSQINGERALFTQSGNISMLLNLLWGAYEARISPRYVVTTTTGIPGQALSTIPEREVINMAGSWYHASRGVDSANLSLAYRQWGFDSIELRTSIVYGIQSVTLKRLGEYTRFDTDPYFGTVLNRFIYQAINEEPITIYGKGEQTKPFISLEDCVISLKNAIKFKKPKGHSIYNQVTRMVSINDLAKMVQDATGCEIKHIKNPRKENETFKMKFQTTQFKKLLGKDPTDIRKDISGMVEKVQQVKSGNRDRIWEV